MKKKANPNDTVNATETELPSVQQAVKKYFDYLSLNPELEAFKEGIQECIQHFMKPGPISSTIPLDRLTYRFQSSVIPDEPQPLASYLEFIKKDILPHAVNVGRPRYIGHMTSLLPVFFQYITQLMTVMNQNNVKVETSRVYTLLERQTLAMLHRLVYDLSESFYDANIQEQASNLGIITSCGTLANITALWIARNKALQPDNDYMGLQSEGFAVGLKHYGYSDAVIIGSAKMHYSMDKLGSLIGLGAQNVLKVSLDSSGAIDIKALKKTIAQCKEERRLIVAVVGIAGSTETGQVDDLPYMAEVSKENGVHFHVDAAWGGPLLFSEKYRPLLNGIQLADSVTICGHKQLYLPQGISVVLCRDPGIVQHIKATAGYQARIKSFDLGKHSPEGSRPATCAYLHAGLFLLGKKGYAYLVEEGMSKALLFAQKVKEHPAFELMDEPRTNIVVYRYIPENMRQKIKDESFNNEDQYVINCINEVLQDRQFLMGQSFISRSTLLQSKYGKKTQVVVLRAVFSNPLTLAEDLDVVLADQVGIGDVVLKGQSMSFAEVLKLLYQQTSSFNRQ